MAERLATSRRVVRVLITGAAGMVGAKLAERLARDGVLAGVPIAHLLLADVVEPARPARVGFDSEVVVGDLEDDGVLADLLEDRPDVIFHLAAVVSAAAERDLEEGYRTNLDGMRLLLEGIRTRGSEYRPRASEDQVGRHCHENVGQEARRPHHPFVAAKAAPRHHRVRHCADGGDR